MIFHDRGNPANTTAQSTSDLSPKHQTSKIFLKTSDLMIKHQKWQHWLQMPNGNRHLRRRALNNGEKIKI